MGKIKSRKIIYLLCILLLCIICFIIFISIRDYKRIKKYDNKVFYGVYLRGLNLSGISISKLPSKLDEYGKQLLSKKINLTANGQTFTYTYSNLGVSINSEDIVEKIKLYQSKLSYFDKLCILYKKKHKVFKYSLVYNDDVINNTLNNISGSVNKELVNGHFYMSLDRNLSYIPGVNGYTLDVPNSFTKVKNEIKKNNSIELIGNTVQAENNDSYKSIDTKVSSFTTTFNPYISRATNLITGLNYIDGAIIEPGEVFSFYKYAGPYDKKGYVFYYEFVGNGVCQIATTTYQAVLLGGLEIVKRYPHDKKSVYVAGGLDATVASYSSGWNVDMQFKNTYKYPIYVSAYAIGGVAYVDLWSNSNAKEGKTYTMESVQTGARSYNTYRHTFQNGVEISRDFVASTWYTKD